MAKYLLKRAISALPIFWLGITLTFLIVHLAPGSPLDKWLTPTLSAETRAILTERFGLDKALPHRYLFWLERVVVHGDFGCSFASGEPVMKLIRRTLPDSMMLAGLGCLMALVVAMSASLVTIFRPRSVSDQLINLLMLVLFAIPTFWLGLMLLRLFSIGTGWLPAAGRQSWYYPELTGWQQGVDLIRHLVLPVMTLALPLAAVFYRYLRAEVLRIRESEFAVAARIRGLSPLRIGFSYILRNALLPLLNILGLTFPALFSGALLVEIVFGWPGMGRLLYDAVLGRDYPVIMAGNVIAFAAVIAGNLLADLLLVLADPRLHHPDRRAS